MNLLTLDTTFDKTYLTLILDGHIVTSLTINSDREKYHSAYLISNIANLLKKHNLKMNDINKLAINIGPGSFTGIRVCLTVAKIIANQLDIEVICVSSLEILAQLNKENTQTLVALDARRDKFYTALYDKESKKELLSPKTLTEKELQELVNNKEYTIICDNATAKVLMKHNIECFSFEGENIPLGECLANIAIKKCNEQNAKWYEVNPLYIQPPPITLGNKR